jgi:hypothetical protein
VLAKTTTKSLFSECQNITQPKFHGSGGSKTQVAAPPTLSPPISGVGSPAPKRRGWVDVVQVRFHAGGLSQHKRFAEVDDINQDWRVYGMGRDGGMPGLLPSFAGIKPGSTIISAGAFEAGLGDTSSINAGFTICKQCGSKAGATRRGGDIKLINFIPVDDAKAQW